MSRVSEFATLNANYLMRRLEAAGFELAFRNLAVALQCFVLENGHGSGKRVRRG